MNKKAYDVAVIGAGSAGLSAIDEIEKVTKNFILINHGELGTTCARVGCMPSKVLIQIANDFHRRKHFAGIGVNGSKHLRVDSKAVLKYVRKLRDRFVKGVLKEMESLGDRHVQGFVRFLDPTSLKIDNQEIRAKRVIIATGSTPKVPVEWKSFSESIITTDALFEMEELPRSMVAMGLGPIGLEMSQALSRLGVKTIAMDRSRNLATLTDPVVNDFAKGLLESEFPMKMETEGKVSRVGNLLEVTAGRKTFRTQSILASLGRQPNLKTLHLDEIGVKLDEDGVPKFNKNSLQIGDLPLFIVGDSKHGRPVLHEAADEGRIAGFNSVRKNPRSFIRRVPMTVIFCEPNIATVGETFSELKGKGFIVGEARLNEGRSIILSQDGLLRIYGSPRTGAIWGAEMVAPHGEHLAHLIASMIHSKMTVFDALRLPFYHPTLEEGLRDALRSLAKKVKGRKSVFDLASLTP